MCTSLQMLLTDKNIPVYEQQSYEKQKQKPISKDVLFIGCQQKFMVRCLLWQHRETLDSQRWPIDFGSVAKETRPEEFHTGKILVEFELHIERTV